MIIQTGKLLILTVKTLVVVFSILMLMFILGDGLPDFSEMSPRETILLICFIGILIGMNFIWWREKTSAWIIVGSSIAFWLIQVIYTASFWMHWLFLLYPLMAVMIFLSYRYPEYQISDKKKKKRIKRK